MMQKHDPLVTNILNECSLVLYDLHACRWHVQDAIRKLARPPDVQKQRGLNLIYLLSTRKTDQSLSLDSFVSSGEKMTMNSS